MTIVLNRMKTKKKTVVVFRILGEKCSLIIALHKTQIHLFIHSFIRILGKWNGTNEQIFFCLQFKRVF